MKRIIAHYEDEIRKRLRIVNINGVLVRGVHNIEIDNFIALFTNRYGREVARIVLAPNEKITFNKVYCEYKMVKK